MIVETAENPAEIAPKSNSLGRRVAIDASWALVGAVFSRGLTLAASVAAGRLLGVTKFGELGMIQSTQGLLGILAGAGMGLAATKFAAEFRTHDSPRAGRYVGFALFVAIASSAAISPLLYVSAGAIARHVLQASHLTTELQIATGLVFFGTLNGVQTGAIIGMGDFRSVAMLNILRGAALCTLSVAGILFWGLMGGVIGLVASEIVAVIGNQYVLRRLIPDLQPRWPANGATWREFQAMCQFSLLALCGSICFTLTLWFTNVLLVNQPEGYAALGIFSAADRWRQLVLFLPATISPLILSTLSNLHGQKSHGEFRRMVWFNIWISLSVVLVPSALIAAASPWGMLVFGEDYRGGWKTLAVLAVSSIAVVMNNVLGQVLVSQGGIRGRFLLDVFLSAVLAVSSWLLIPPLRDLGMAWSNLFAYGATALALAACVVRYMKTPKLLEAAS